MAIYSSVPPPDQQQHPGAAHHQHTASAASTATVDIEAWTLSALQALSVSPVARGTGTPLSIPIDAAGRPAQRSAVIVDPDHPAAGLDPPRRPPSRRDSQKRREAILKGKEGSRARRRWENDRLMHVPNVQPPLPTDWEVHPTHPVHVVPYAVAQYWDRGLRQRVEEERAAAANLRRQRAVAAATGAPYTMVQGPATRGLGLGHVPRELRNTAKRTPAVKGWVRVLEEPVRRFLEEDAEEQQGKKDDVEDWSDDEEEIVFVGRGAGREAWKKARREVKGGEIDRGVVFDELGDDDSAAFKRWLTHSISDYYGLASQSATVGKPPKKVVYVGIKEVGTGCRPKLKSDLPRPMWELF